MEFLRHKLEMCERLILHERSDKCSVLENKQVESSKSSYKRDSGSVNNTTYLRV